MAELVERLPILAEQAIEKGTSGWVRERTENLGSLFHLGMICDYMVTYQVVGLPLEGLPVEEWQDRSKSTSDLSEGRTL